LGYISENLISGLVETAQWNQIDEFVENGFDLIDVRSPGEFGRGSIPGARNIPVDEIRGRISELTNKNILVNCQVGQRGHTATMLLKELGFNAVNLDGGYLTWSNSPIANKEIVICVVVQLVENVESHLGQDVDSTSRLLSKVFQRASAAKATPTIPKSLDSYQSCFASKLNL
jgi:rhodanese-related sulfurtransferase